MGWVGDGEGEWYVDMLGGVGVKACVYERENTGQRGEYPENIVQLALFLECLMNSGVLYM